MAETARPQIVLSDALVMHTPPLADWLVVAPLVLGFAFAALCLMTRKNTAGQPALALTGLALMLASKIGLFVHVLTSGTVTRNFPGNADINGPFSATQVGSLAGTVAPGLDGINFASDLQLDINAAIGCTGTGCASLGFPVNESGTFPFTIGFLEITDIDILGAAGISVDIPVEIDGVLGTLSLVGTEVNRTFIPEPGTALLFGLGLAGLGASRRRALSG